MRNLLKLFLLVPLGTLLWPSSGPAWECDPAISRGSCAGSGQKFPTIDHSAVRAPVARERNVGVKPIAQTAGRSVASQNALLMVRAEAAMPETFGANRARPTLASHSNPDVNVRNDAYNVSETSSSMNPAPQPGNAALLIAGLLGVCAVARRRISSIPG